MAFNRILTSIHGKRFGLSASGTPVFQPTTSSGLSHVAEISSAGVFNSSITSFNSTITELIVAKYKSVVESISSSAATMLNYGISIIASDVITGSVMTLPAPEVGLHKQIWFDTSASGAMTVQTTAASVIFEATFGSSSSSITMSVPGGLRGARITLFGQSATRWAVIAKTAAA